MDFRCVKFLLVLTFVRRISSLPLACSYNGTSYKEGKSVKTEEPCLTCVCQKGALECSLRVCAEYPTALPPACFLLHKPNECCPQLLCEEKFSSTDVDLRIGFQAEIKLHGNDCAINGSVYAEGSAVASSVNCEYCYCVGGDIKCIKPRCLQFFGECKAVYEKSSCCPTHYDCRNVDVNYLTVQIENFAKVEPTDSITSLSNEDLSLDMPFFNTSESIIFNKSENASIEESEKTTTEEVSTEETTVLAEKETTTPEEEDLAITNGFQTTKSENSEESTKVTEAETTTTESVDASLFSLSESQTTSSVQIRSKTDFQEESESTVENSKNVEDYDSYDYSEPQLPPSLPNLVIFPFVAADAVVKDENADSNFEKVGIERIDAHPVFYKDYFSPPLKTEGGFIPKEPSKNDESFYDHAYLSREQMEPPSESFKENQEVRVQANNSLLTSSELIFFENQEESDSTVKSDEFRETPFQIKDKTTELQGNHQTKKPVTVAYKNLVVDFYPNYLITTTRGDFKQDPTEKLKATNENQQHTTGKPLVRTKTTRETSTEDIPQTTVSLTTKETSFFEEIIKSFLSNDAPETTAATETAIVTPKYKYSSKIKGPIMTTVEPKQEEKVNEEVNTVNLTTELYSWLNSIVKPDVVTEKTKQLTKIPLYQLSESAEKEREKIEFFESVTEESPSREDRTKSNAGALLKLAGCNIYGMMYRVGKIITELSGPCLECLCTESGVQCRDLKC